MIRLAVRYSFAKLLTMKLLTCKIECEKVKKIIDNITCPIWICGGSGVVEGWLGSGTERGELFKSQKGGNAMLEEIIRKWGGHEVSAMQVYTDLFGLGEGLIQRQDEEPGAFKSNPLGYWKNDGEQRGHRRILFDDTFEETLKEMQEADFSIMNGLTYFGKRNAAENASKMYAMIFDVDGITDETLNNFLSGAYVSEAYPVPNYVVLSGHNIHLYYRFEIPIALYPNIKLQLKELKYSLTGKMWNRYTSTEKKVQFQGINQGFRVIGGKTKIEGVRVRAFELNVHPFSLKELCQFVPEAKRVDETKQYREHKYTLEKAKQLFPIWYERRVLNKQLPGRWTDKRDLYDWWKLKIKESASYGHRYFAIMALAIYGIKCDIPKAEVEADAMEFIPFLDGLKPDAPFTEEDCKSALECFDEKYVTFPRADIEKITGIQILQNKRNGRKQQQHIKMVNAMRIMKRDMLGEDEYKNNGRPDKAELVRQWRLEHPEGRKVECIKDTGLSKPTVYKWWD